MNHDRWWLVAGLLVLGLLLGTGRARATDGVLEIGQTCAVNTGCFAGDAPGYPVTITAAGSYRLTSNLVLPGIAYTGIDVASPDVSIDLNGFEIVGEACVGATTDCTPALGAGSGVKAASSGGPYYAISVRNGTVTGMGFCGVFLDRQSEVRNVRVRWNRGDGIRVGYGSTVTDSISHQNGSYGIQSFDDSTVSGNTVHDNGGDGIVGNSGATISGNTVFGNGGDGIRVYSGALVEGNTLRGNTGFGINLSLNASSYRGNMISGNTAGTVTGGVDAGGNVCGTSTTCP